MATTTYALSSGSVTTTAAETVNELKILGAATPTTLTLGGVLTIGTAGQVAGLLFDNSSGSAVIAAGTSAAYTLGGAASDIVVCEGIGNDGCNAGTGLVPIDGTAHNHYLGLISACQGPVEF